jgi:hypothetical protein
MRRRWFAGWGRTAIAGVLTITLTVAVLGGTSDAAEDPGGPIGPGRGTAGATILSFGPTTGNLELALTAGQARAATTGTLGEALSRSLSLGLIGSSLTAEGCDGGAPLVAASSLPQATRVDNRKGPKSAESTEVPILSPVLGVGNEKASADVTPVAKASSVLAPITFGPLLALRGGESKAESTVLPGKGRRATASVAIDLDLGGLVTLTGLRWTASHETGAKAAASGRFVLAGVSIGGVDIPFDIGQQGIEALGAVLDGALAPLGIRVEMPHVERIKEPVDLVRVTPLRILFGDSPASAGVRPVLDATRELRSQLYDALVAATCSTSSALLIVDLVLGVPAGTGSLVLELGGVEAQSSELDEEDLLGGLPPGGGLDLGTDTGSAGGGVLPGDGLPPGAGGVPATQVVDRGPIDRVCESIHPNGSPSCSRGAATAVGVIGTVGTLGLAGLDLRRRRRAGTQPTADPTTTGGPS